MHSIDFPSKKFKKFIKPQIKYCHISKHTKMQNEKCKSFSLERRKLEKNTNVLPHQLERKYENLMNCLLKYLQKTLYNLWTFRWNFLFPYFSVLFLYILFCLPYDLIYEVMYVQRKFKKFQKKFPFFQFTLFSDQNLHETFTLD